MRSVTLAPTRKPDVPLPPPSEGASDSPSFRRGLGEVTFKVRANASPIRQTSARLVGRVMLRHQRGA